MHTTVLIWAIVLLPSLGLIFFPNSVSATLGLGTLQPSRARVVGVLGLAWVAMALATNRRLALFDLSVTTKEHVAVAKYFVEGLLVGFFFGLSARRKSSGVQ